MAILRNTITLLLPLMMTGCYSDFEPKLDTEPTLCLNSLIKAGETINVNVSHTWVYTDIKGEEDHSVKDAEILILANSQPVDNTYIAREGDHIQIKANSPTYGSAEAEVTVPYATPAADIDYYINIRSIDADYKPGEGFSGRIVFDINATIDIPTSPERDHYYRLGYQYFYTFTDDPTYTEEDFSSPTLIFTRGNFSTPDPIFSEYVSDFEDMMGYGTLYDNAFFTDRLFEDESRKINFGFNGCEFSLYGYDPESDIIEFGYNVTLNTISNSYFDWAMYFWNSGRGMIGEFSDMGLAEPIWGYSNVSTGAGVVAAQSSADVTINLKDFLKHILSDINK